LPEESAAAMLAMSFVQAAELEILYRVMNFEWDARKARLNEAKHGVTFDEAATLLATR
jgi:hypothetical protein